ncbi:TIR domain-containing protein [Leptolyngbyaceae cyanobacterium CCMR0082]|uniref:TIR domain-containing protein n=2 Tax=Adonisia turfae TaxID=2950184 RepID=A0A6M0SGQ2_9CYAN|nr:AAA-like domain-containing protein [Adonisia turfae]NEZ57839.1 TIR domain-containing protein [Adonisia turfae CCMR0081]NEZ67739.1 TIR domain-containing protein [Adonisia turfae CCMR0082]
MDVRKVLILAVNPKDTADLRLDEEIRQIKEALKLSEGRANFEVVIEPAVRTGDLHRHLLQHKPQIVHFSGHGVGARGLAFEDKNGISKLISTATLTRLFRLCGGVECVLLNACHSVAQANAILEHVNHVIGMTDAIGDQASIKFAEGFYDGLGYGRNYADAFEFGLVGIGAEGIPEEETPVLRIKGEGSKENVKAPEVAHCIPLGQTNPQAKIAQKQIFISYKRDVVPDETVALQLYEALGQSNDVFIDQRMLVGTRWAEQLETNIRQADAVVVLLSTHSVNSEMVLQEIELAHKVAEANGGKPRILPVRLAYRDPFQHPLSVYLNPINWALWDSEADTPDLISELQQAIDGGVLSIDEQRKADVVKAAPKVKIPQPLPVAQPIAKLELPEGTMDTASDFYIERDCDRIALSVIQQQGVTMTIKGPRQMGKSSLLNRLMKTAIEAGKQVVFLDFQLFDRAALQNADEFYQQFCFWLTDELDMDDEVEAYWKKNLGNSQRCTRYIGRHILKNLDQPLLLAMDEVERIFDTPYRNDFFSMLRSWHNQRATKKIWKQLDLTCVTSTEPYLLIDDLNQSPFNVGENLRLQSFTLQQVNSLNQKHGAPLNISEIKLLMQLVNGHPYLIRKALYLIASSRLSTHEFFARVYDENGPFSDHLKSHLFQLYNNQILAKGFLKILKQQSCDDEVLYSYLYGAGLVQRKNQKVFAKCPLYQNYFEEHLTSSIK